MGVVYFDQCLGVARYTQAESNMLFYHFCKKNIKRKKRKIRQNEAKKRVFGLAPKCWWSFFILVLLVFVWVCYSLTIYWHLRPSGHQSRLSFCLIYPSFSSFLYHFHVKNRKSIFQPLAFGMGSTQTLVKVYNNWVYYHMYYLILILLIAFNILSVL